MERLRKSSARWVRFAYVDDVGNAYVGGVLSRNFSPQQINAAMNTTIIIERMLRMGRSRIRP
jgi:hypothetical protein